MKYCYDGLEFDSREDALDYIESTVFDSDVVEFMLDNYSEDEIFDMLKIYERDRIKSELVDELAEDIDEEEDEVTIYGDPKSFGDIQHYLEQNGYEITSAEFTRIPNDLKDVTPEQRETIDKMVEKLEEFDDVQNVYTNMKPAED